jgi:hypothetical protein
LSPEGSETPAVRKYLEAYVVSLQSQITKIYRTIINKLK